MPPSSFLSTPRSSSPTSSGNGVICERDEPPIHARTLRLLRHALGLVALSSLVRGLGALASVAVAYFLGTSAGMDHYTAFLMVMSTACSLLACSFPTLVGRHLAACHGTNSLKAHVAHCRQWAWSLSRASLTGYLALTPGLVYLLKAKGLPTFPWDLLALLWLGAPCIFVAAQTAVEQALLQANGRAYLAVSCTGLLTGVSLLAALVSARVGGAYLCAAGRGIGAVLELAVTRRVVNRRYGNSESPCRFWRAPRFKDPLSNVAPSGLVSAQRHAGAHLRLSRLLTQRLF